MAKTTIAITLEPSDLRSVDALAKKTAREDGDKPNRSATIRNLIRVGLKASTKKARR